MTHSKSSSVSAHLKALFTSAKLLHQGDNMEDTITQTTKKTTFTTTNAFEQKFGYFRAVKRGPYIAVSGTTALMENPPDTGSKVEHAGNAYKQAELAMKRCMNAVSKLGGMPKDVIRVKMFVARHEDCAAVGSAFKNVFGGDQAHGVGSDIVGAAATMIVVPGGFVDEDMLMEVEVDAYVF